MNLFEHLALLAVLVLAAGFLSLTEISLAGARKIKLKLLAEAGDDRARKVMALQAEKRDADAAAAFTQAQASGMLTPELQAFVERRLRQLGR